MRSEASRTQELAFYAFESVLCLARQSAKTAEDDLAIQTVSDFLDTQTDWMDDLPAPLD